MECWNGLLRDADRAATKQNCVDRITPRSKERDRGENQGLAAS
jgi:hypothetical protein